MSPPGELAARKNALRRAEKLAVFRERLNLSHTILGRALADAGSELPDHVRDLLRQALTSLDDAPRWKGGDLPGPEPEGSSE